MIYYFRASLASNCDVYLIASASTRSVPVQPRAVCLVVWCVRLRSTEPRRSPNAFHVAIESSRTFALRTRTATMGRFGVAADALIYIFHRVAAGCCDCVCVFARRLAGNVSRVAREYFLAQQPLVHERTRAHSQTPRTCTYYSRIIRVCRHVHVYTYLCNLLPGCGANANQMRTSV